MQVTKRAIWGLALTLSLLLVTHTAHAQSTSYWSSADSGTWNWNNADNWTPDMPTSTTARVYWTNNAAVPYTIKLTGPATSGMTRVTSDKLVFDLNGQRWDAPDSGPGDYGGSNPDASHWLGGDAGEVCEVVFSSSAPGENIVKLNSGLQRGWRWGNGTANSTIQVTTNLGYGVVVQVPPNGGPYGAHLIIRGPGAEVRNPAANYASISMGNVYVVDGGYLNFGNCYAVSLTGNTTVDHAKMRLYVSRSDGYTYIGSVQAGQVVLTNQAVWVSANSLQVGYNIAKGSLIVDNSTFVGQNIKLGLGPRHGEAVVRNGGQLVLTNGYFQVTTGPSTVLTNRLVLDNGMINFAATTAGCAITNDGLMRANGTISCVGTPATLCNRSRLEIAGGQGLLSLTNTILDNTSSGTLAFGFQADSNDAIQIDDGTATIGGTSCFTTVSFTPQRGADQRWVFVEADSIVYTASDNMEALMGSFGLVSGSDYVFGVKDIDGRQALQLWVKPPGGSLIMIH